MNDPLFIAIGEAGRADTESIGRSLRVWWNATTIVVHGEFIDAAALPALIAANDRGLATYCGFIYDAGFA